MALSVLPKLHGDRYLVELASTGRPSSLGRSFSKEGLIVRYLNDRVIRGLIRIARERNLDVVHLYGFRAAALGRVIFLVFSPRTKRVVGLRHLYPYDRYASGGWQARFLDLIERVLSRITHGYLANSLGAARRLVDQGVPPSKLAYTPNGIDIGEWTDVTETSMNNPPILVCVARFVPFKRHADLLRSLALLPKSCEWHCDLVGSGPLEAKLRELARYLKISDQVEFLGQLTSSQVRTALMRADIFVLTSENEGMPRSVMEAMACGLPVVATDVNGSNDLVVDSETGLLTSLGNPQSIAEGLRSLLRDGDARRAMGQAGRRRIAEHFSLDACVRAVEQSYEALYESRPLPGPVPPATDPSGSSKG